MKTLSDWCLEYKDSSSFKKRLDSYFTFNESTFVLQHIAEHSLDYKQYFAVFYSNKKFITKPELKKLRDRLSRFLESYHNSSGLNFVSGMVRLLLDDFKDTDGKPRMETALKAIAEANKDTLLDNEFVLGVIPFLLDANLPSDRLTELCPMIIKYFPSLTAEMADELQMPWLYNDVIQENIRMLKQINRKLYEQIGRI